MTDNDYAAIIYCRVFHVSSDDGDSYTRGILDAISTLSIREQTALDSYFRQGNTFEQTGIIIGDLKEASARRIINKALLKLRHPSRLQDMSVKAIIKRKC